jgi:hypothetical protein
MNKITIGTEKQIKWAEQIKVNILDILRFWIIDIKEDGEIKVKYTAMKSKEKINDYIINYIDENKTDAEWYINKRNLNHNSSSIEVSRLLEKLFEEIYGNENELKKLIKVLEG